MLGRPFGSITPASNNNLAELTFANDGNEEKYTADCLIRRSPPSQSDPTRTVYRALVVLDRRIKLVLATPTKIEDDEDDEEGSKAVPIAQQAENALFVLPPSSLGDNVPDQPVFALMAGEGSFSAPSGQCECRSIAIGYIMAETVLI